jgi:pilus assembly protein Flp/PilA
MKNLIQRFVREEDGQDIIEYALLAAFISVIAIAAIIAIGGRVNNIYTGVSSQVNRTT